MYRILPYLAAHLLVLQSMLPQAPVRDVGEDIQDDNEVFHQEAGTDGEVSQFNDALNCEVFHQDAVTNHGVVFHQDGGTEDEVEVLSRQSFRRKSTTSSSAQSSSSSQS